MMRTMILAVATLMAVSSPAIAQQSGELPPIDVLKKHPHPTNDCSKTEAGSKENLDCINRQLNQTVDHVNPPTIGAPLSAGSSDTKIGIVNLPAVQQQYGQAYGHSVIPFRPTQTFTAPLAHH
jgi:hypothetical protein